MVKLLVVLLIIEWADKYTCAQQGVLIESTIRLCTVSLDKAILLDIFDPIIASGDHKSQRPCVVLPTC